MERYSWSRLREFGSQYLDAKGVLPEQAAEIAELAIQTEAMGVETHGMALFPYFEKVIPEGLDPKALPEVVREKGATALVDGNSGFSQLSLLKARELGLEKVQKFGTAVIAGRNCSWLGALGHYLVPIAEQGYLAQLWAQTSACRDAAPFGGIDPRFSTNPVALAFPMHTGVSIADFSTTMVSMGRVGRMIAKRETASVDMFLDAEGRVSRDPDVVPKGGSILFLGGEETGHKGYAFSLFTEALAASAGGSANNPKAESRQTFTLMLIDPEAFGGADYYRQEMKRFVSHVKSSRVRPGWSEIRLPGERRMKLLAQAQAEGIGVDEGLITRLNELGQRYGLAPL
jgi:LDH2 family malate/lactate/ureidoglycolate dehydrogenase